MDKKTYLNYASKLKREETALKMSELQIKLTN